MYQKCSTKSVLKNVLCLIRTFENRITSNLLIEKLIFWNLVSRFRHTFFRAKKKTNRLILLLHNVSTAKKFWRFLCITLYLEIYCVVEAVDKSIAANTKLMCFRCVVPVILKLHRFLGTPVFILCLTVVCGCDALTQCMLTVQMA